MLSPQQYGTKYIFIFIIFNLNYEIDQFQIDRIFLRKKKIYKDDINTNGGPISLLISISLL